MRQLDTIDKAILRILQNGSTVAIDDVAQKVGLSTTPCWRRIHRLKSRGFVSRSVTILDPAKLNVGMTAFMFVRAPVHTENWSTQFAMIASAFPEVVELNRMSGSADFLMRIVVPDLTGYDRFRRRLSGRIALTDVSASFAMEQMKYTTQLPLDYLKVTPVRSRA
jgi:Lrp/AsnC family transcriptional regulator